MSVRLRNWIWFLAAYAVGVAVTLATAAAEMPLVEAFGFIALCAVPALVAQAADRRTPAGPQVRQHWTLVIALVLSVGLVYARLR